MLVAKQPKWMIILIWELCVFWIKLHLCHSLSSEYKNKKFSITFSPPIFHFTVWIKGLMCSEILHFSCKLKEKLRHALLLRKIYIAFQKIRTNLKNLGFLGFCFFCFLGFLLVSKIKFALYIILLRDVPLLKSDFFLRSEFLFDLSVGICRAVEESNPLRYTCRQELMNS